jgi:hypothetical protein
MRAAIAARRPGREVVPGVHAGPVLDEALRRAFVIAARNQEAHRFGHREHVLDLAVAERICEERPEEHGLEEAKALHQRSAPRRRDHHRHGTAVRVADDVRAAEALERRGDERGVVLAAQIHRERAKARLEAFDEGVPLARVARARVQQEDGGAFGHGLFLGEGKSAMCREGRSASVPRTPATGERLLGRGERCDEDHTVRGFGERRAIPARGQLLHRAGIFRFA